MVTKKVLGRWIAIPALASVVGASLIFRLLAGPVSTCQKQESGGNLMFLALTKEVESA